MITLAAPLREPRFSVLPPPVARTIQSTARVHILAQHVWPDDGPTGLYAEQVAQSLTEQGARVALVAGMGRYRQTCRPKPDANIVRLDHFCGNRDSLATVALEYHSLAKAFRGYIRQYVNSGDVVILGSFPPNTLDLYKDIQERGGVAIYWLQDYYPEILRALWDYPAPLRRAATRHWDRKLTHWDYVVKAANNLGYDGPNARVIRNWPTLDLGPERPFIPKTALYSGNLSYAHGMPQFIEVCEALRSEGYKITVRGDGPGFKRLPTWIQREAPLDDIDALIDSYWRAETHIVAADPKIQKALFPSKFWNSRASGRRIVTSGFCGEMEEEYTAALTAPYEDHKQQWVRLVSSLL